ncbi:MAG: beta-N-acetylhexosaminidase [Bacilli bacterium]|jgi:beta-N-acetylhexosaminidase|nr:beta-N-acetylhexosaminidase [Bacilli bacterium]
MKKILKLCSLTFIIIVLSACFKNDTTNYNNNKDTKNHINDASKIVNSMTIDEKIGQLFIIHYNKPEITEEFKHILETVKPGGFTLFNENIKTYEQTTKLIKDINSTAKIPMFISIDQEGGRVQRLKSMPGMNIINIPSMSKIGESNDENQAYNTGITIANDLKKFSINMNFAPVIDIYLNPKNTVIGDRSFGNNAKTVSKMGLSLANALKNNNIIPVYKHFPGHGNTEKDSHVEMPIITKTKEELYQDELIPFKNAISNNADIIMVGHLALPKITNDYTPASLSKQVVTDLLKNELGYKNLIITDALNMKAITNNYSEKQIYELAINAGVDILLMPNDPILAFNSIKKSLEEGTINETTITKSVEKIIALKLKYNIIDKEKY